ncbi:unnamed protein product, partial [Discosporangium mesarthrocarpum]
MGSSPSLHEGFELGLELGQQQPLGSGSGLGPASNRLSPAFAASAGLGLGSPLRNSDAGTVMELRRLSSAGSGSGSGDPPGAGAEERRTPTLLCGTPSSSSAETRRRRRGVVGLPWGGERSEGLG